MRVHELPMGSGVDQLRTAGGRDGYGDVSDVGKAFRASAILFVDSRSLSSFDPNASIAVYGKRYDFGWLEDRLIPLGFRLIFCSRSADSFESAREERLKVSGNPKQYLDLGVFLNEQELMKEMVALSTTATHDGGYF